MTMSGWAYIYPDGSVGVAPSALLAPAGVPTLTTVAHALGKQTSEIANAYAAEVSDQARRCRVEPYNSALALALVRRVQHSIAMASLPLGVMTDETGSTRIGSSDPEVRRLEAPYRRVVVG